MAGFSDLVIVIPGILGSRLVRRHGPHKEKTTVVWDFSIARLPRLLRELVSGGLIVEGDGVDPPDDDIEADALFNYQLLPGFFGVDDYDALVTALRAAVPGKDRQVLTFPYDWRLSNRHAAAHLATLVGPALREWAASSGAKDPKVWLIAHSMGGLVARHYAEHLGGAENIRTIVTIGSPHRGSVNALDILSNGKRFGLLDLSSMLRSLPSAYELLPLFPVLRVGTGPSMELLRLAEVFGLDAETGAELLPPEDLVVQGVSRPVPGVERRRLQQALRFHADIRGPAERRARDGVPTVYSQRAIFNRRQHTLHSARVADGSVDLFMTYPIRDGAGWIEDDARGDGTVPAQASVPIEWDDTVNAIANAQMHAGMPATIQAQDAVLNWLKPADVRGFRGGDVPSESVIVLDVPSDITRGDALLVTVAVGTPTFGTVEIRDMNSNWSQSQPATITDDPAIIEFPGLAGGTYRVSVQSTNAAQPPVSDYVYVHDPSLV